MNLGSASTQTAASTETRVRSEAVTGLTGHWLIVARAVWVALVVLLFVAYVISLPDYFAQLQRVCARAPCAYGQISLYTVGALHTLGLSVSSYAVFNVALAITLAFIHWAVSGVIFWRKSEDWMALLFALLLFVGGTLYVVETEVTGYTAWRLPAQLLVQLASVLFYLVFSLFPDGRLVPRWTRWLVVGFCAFIVILSLFPNPFVLPLWLTVFIRFLWFGFYASLAVGQIYRYRHVSGPVQRQQTKWIVYGLAIIVVMLVGGDLPFLVFPQSPYLLVNNPVLACMALLIPLTVGIAILRYRLWDIDIIINRTLVYGTLTVSIVALYVLVVVGLGTLLQAQGNPGIALLATGLVAVLFQPWRHRLQRLVNRLMYGDRDDPYRVLTHLGQRLEATLAPEAVLPTIVETVAQALKLPYAAIALKEEDTFTPATSFGTSREGEGLVCLPLVAQHELVGELVLAPRARGDVFTPADQRLLEDLSRQIGVAVYAVRLTADLKRLTVDLQRSRERLVTAREEERRRLRRDLHDGLGPQLASLTLKLETARNRLAHDPLAQTLLSDLAARTQDTVADIRRLVYALRPPALDELGLLSALHELTLQYGDQVAMHLDVPDCLPELPAAVEVAVYRIAQEALTNVVRHAHAHHCDIRLVLDEAEGLLSLSIEDDGGGLPPSRPMGIGLTSMRERAEELGGTWAIEPVESGGTRVFARLPLVLSETTDTLVAIPTGVPQEE